MAKCSGSGEDEFVLGSSELRIQSRCGVTSCQVASKLTTLDKAEVAEEEKPLSTTIEAKPLLQTQAVSGTKKAAPTTTVATQTTNRMEPVTNNVATGTNEEKITSPLGESKELPSPSNKPKQWLKLETYSGRTEMETCLRKFAICTRIHEWSDKEKLHQMLFSLVEPASQHESTGFASKRVFFGRETGLPNDLVLGDCGQNNIQWSADDYVSNRTEDMRNVFQHMQKQAVSRSFRYDMRVKTTKFYPRKRVKLKGKWAKWYCGPYKIVEKISSVLYRIQKSARSQAQLVYVDKLKAFEGDHPPDWAEPDPEPVERIEFPGTDDLEDIPQENSRPRRTIKKPVRYSC